MAINLTKGHTVNLTKESPNLKRLYIGVGWDPIEASLNMDVDASIICINKEGKKQKLVYYGNLKYHHGAIKHHGDNLTGCGDGDDEKIEVKLDELPEKIACLSIIINIYSAHIRRQDFSCVKNCFVHVDDMKTGKEIVRYDIDGNFNGKTGIFVADVYRCKGEWKFKAIGEGVEVDNIDEMVRMKCK